MKNLQIRDINRIHLPQTAANLNSIVIVNNKIFYVDNGNLFYCLEKSDVVHRLCEDLQCITDLVYLTILEQIWFATGHQFVFLNPITLDICIVEAEHGFLNATWSPNQEYLAVCDVDGRVKCYRDVFHNLTPVINFLDKSNIPLTKNIDNLNVKVRWRDNSQYFCVCYFDDGYKLRIYNVGGQIEKEKLEITYMLPHITWRRGMIVCATQDESNRFSIVMYEKNGLFHNHFCLDEKVKAIHDMKWNETGDILAVHMSTEEGSFLNIYTQINFNFLLKQQLVYTKENPLTTFNFMYSSKHIANIIVTNTRSIISYQFMYQIQHGVLSSGYAFCAEVDGNLLKFKRIDGDDLCGTQESLQILDFTNPINTVAFDHTFKHCLIVDSYSNLFVYAFEEMQFTEIKKKLSYISETVRFMPTNIYNLCFTTQDKVFATYINNVNTHDLYELDLNTLEMLPHKLEDNNSNMIYVHEYNKLIKLKQDGSLYLDDELQQDQLNFKVHKIEYVIINDKLYILILDIMDQLYINDNIVFRGASSFIIHSGYLFITTYGNNLHCIRLIPDNMQKIINKESFNSSIYTRQCEDGSILLCGAPKRKHVLLHHTRGNTEMVLCRNVALDQLQDFMKAKEWKEAYEYVRVERLDLNLLVDLNPYTFLDHIGDFIAAIEVPSLIQTFILNLKDENVLMTTYKDIMYNNLVVLDSKKKRICKAILDVIRNDMKVYVKVVIIASYVTEGVQGSMEILYYLFQTYGDVEEIIKDGINCLRLYVLSNDIHKACLSKVDINFAKCIFAKLNFDPKLHEKLFDEINKHKSNVSRQFYIVHNFMENYKEALYYLVASCMFLRVHSEEHDCEEAFQEMIEYAKIHHLHNELYKYSHKLDFYDKRIIAVYTNTLLNHNRYEEAAMIFAANCMWGKAQDAYINCRMWKEALYAMEQLGVNKTSYIHTLTRSLHSYGNYKDAAHLYEQYLSENDLAVQSLVVGKFFKEAIQCCRKYNKQDAFENIVKPEFNTYYNNIMEKIKSLNTTFTKYFERLQIIRDTEITKAVESTNMGNNYTTDYAESITSSARRSSSTARSRSSSMATSRSRKEERKKQDLREGGIYENIALIRALHDIIREAYDLGSDVKMIISLFVLYEPHGLQSSRFLQDAYSKLLAIVDQNINIIWPADLNSFSVRLTPELQVLRKNLDELDMKYRYPPETPPSNWSFEILDELVDIEGNQDNR